MNRDRPINKNLISNSSSSITNQSIFSTSRFVEISFSITLLSVFICWLFVTIAWRIRKTTIVDIPDDFLPSLNDVILNFKLAIQGVSNVYLDSVLGYLIFLAIALIFITAGKFILDNLIFNTKCDINPSCNISFWEKISISFLLGSLVCSLLWYGLGILGFLISKVAFCVLIIGAVIGLIGFIKNWTGGSYREFFDLDNLPIIEKILFALVIVSVLLWSILSVRPQAYSDTLLTHLVLPNYYINEGRIVLYPYHIHSYFTQNTEMLVIWALLLKSEMAAALIIWGFLVALVVLLYGFLKRLTNRLAALLSILILIGAPAVCDFAATVKNDFPSATFIVAHYIVLLTAFNDVSQVKSFSVVRRWIFLSGLLCGGAVGHKFNAIFGMVFSSLVVLGYDFYFFKKVKAYRYLTLSWILGIMVALGPWIIRTYHFTGNPIYPYLNFLFGNQLVEPWHAPVEQGYSFKSTGWAGMLNYFGSLSGIYYVDGKIEITQWGPSVLFILLFITSFVTCSIPISLILISAFASLVTLVFYSFAVRYQVGFLAFIITISFSRALHILSNSKFQNFFKIATVLLIISCYVQTLSNTKMFSTIREYFSIILSGYPIGNYRTNDMGMDNLRWLTHVMNSRTHSNDKVMYVGVNYAYGLKRKIYFSSDLDRQIIGELAQQADNSNDLMKNLRDIGVSHLLISKSFFTDFSDSKSRYFIRDEHMNKIKSLIDDFMVFRMASPNGNFLWYTFKDYSGDLSLLLDKSDAIRYPYMYVENALSEFLDGNRVYAKDLLEKALDVPMITRNKIFIYSYLGSIYQKLGDQTKGEELLKSAIRFAPHRPEPYFNLAVFYMNTGEKEKSDFFINKCISLGGKPLADSLMGYISGKR